MVKYLNDRAEALLDSACPGTTRPAVSERRPPARPVRKADEDDFVCVPLCEGPVKVRVPKARIETKRRRRHIKGFNADATPC